MASHMPPPDYLADETRGPGLIAADVIMAVVGTVFVGLRFYTRTYIVNKLGLSDWIILIALIFDIGNSAGSIRRRSSFSSPNPPWAGADRGKRRGCHRLDGETLLDDGPSHDWRMGRGMA